MNPVQNIPEYGMYEIADKLCLLEHEVKRRSGHILVSYREKVFLWGGYMVWCYTDNNALN